MKVDVDEAWVLGCKWELHTKANAKLFSKARQEGYLKISEK